MALITISTCAQTHLLVGWFYRCHAPAQPSVVSTVNHKHRLSSFFSTSQWCWRNDSIHRSHRHSETVNFFCRFSIKPRFWRYFIKPRLDDAWISWPLSWQPNSLKDTVKLRVWVKTNPSYQLHAWSYLIAFHQTTFVTRMKPQHWYPCTCKSAICVQRIEKWLECHK
jgi:hypothetical protein